MERRKPLNNNKNKISMTPITLKNIPDNIRKFLCLITFTEGTDLQKTPYNELFGYDNFTSFKTHPNIKVKKGNITSTAAGRYQILYGTFLELGLPDFTPESQDAGAVKLLKRRKAYTLALNGQWEAAIKACNKEWASLPGSPYGQPTHKLADCLTFLKTA